MRSEHLDRHRHLDLHHSRRPTRVDWAVTAQQGGAVLGGQPLGLVGRGPDGPERTEGDGGRCQGGGVGGGDRPTPPRRYHTTHRHRRGEKGDQPGDGSGEDGHRATLEAHRSTSWRRGAKLHGQAAQERAEQPMGDGNDHLGGGAHLGRAAAR